MGIFSKPKLSPEQKQAVEEGKERAMGAIATRIIKFQLRWAAYMQRQTERLTRNGKICALIIFCLIGGGYFFLLVYNGLNGSAENSDPMLVIHTPPNILESDPERFKKHEIIKVLLFKKQLDSLALTPGGKEFIQKLVEQRPGLLDSLHAFEKTYSYVEWLKPDSIRK